MQRTRRSVRYRHHIEYCMLPPRAMNMYIMYPVTVTLLHVLLLSTLVFCKMGGSGSKSKRKKVFLHLLHHHILSTSIEYTGTHTSVTGMCTKFTKAFTMSFHFRVCTCIFQLSPCLAFAIHVDVCMFELLLWKR